MSFESVNIGAALGAIGVLGPASFALVDSLKIVKPSDVSVLKPVADQQSLTLVTCYPFNYVGSAPKRFIVHAKRVDANPQQPPQPLPGS